MSSRDLAEAREYFQAGLALAGELGLAGMGSQGYALTNLADVFSLQGDEDRAQVLYERAAALLREAKEKSMLDYSLRRLGQFALARGDYQTAVALNKQSLELNAEVGEPRGVLACLAGFAGIAAARGQAVPAVRLYGAVEALLHALAVPNLPTDQRAYDQNVAALRAQLDEATFGEAWTEGRVMTTDQAIAYASSVLDARQESGPVALHN